MADSTRRFGEFRFVPKTGELFRQGERVELQNQPARVLELLTEEIRGTREGRSWDRSFASPFVSLQAQWPSPFPSRSH